MKNYMREKLYDHMTKFILLVFFTFILVACCFSAERPVVNVPEEWRKDNWIGSSGEGSCVHASFVTLLRWQGRYRTADMWEKRYGNGEWSNTMDKKLEESDIRYASTSGKDDVEFLEWACRTRRGAGVTVRGGSHMVTLVHLDGEWAAILDNNYTSNFIWIPREKFIAEWKVSYSWAVTPVYKPSAPAPESN